jgi:hypothetical protein
MRHWKPIILTLILLGLTVPAHAAGPAMNAAVGAHGVFYDDNLRPSDFEIGGATAAALSNHLAVVGSTWFGVDESYLRGSLGLRATATEPTDESFAIGVGIQRQACSEPSIRAEEWQGDVSVGWKPWPTTQPRLIVALQGFYGLDTGEAGALAGLRYALGK